MSMHREDPLHDLQQFLLNLRKGEFSGEIEKAFKELNRFLKRHDVTHSYLLNSFFNGLYQEGRDGQQYFVFIAVRTLEFDVPILAMLMVGACVNLYSKNGDDELLSILFDIILGYRLKQFISIEGGQNLRIDAYDSSFAVGLELIRPALRLKMLRLALEKYTQLLITSNAFENQEFSSIVQRLNAVISFLKGFQISELSAHAALAPFTLDTIRFIKSQASQLFGKELSAIEYDEQLYAVYRIPLFPIIEADKVIFIKNKLSFTNEGLGALPPVIIYLRVGEKKLVLGELTRPILPDNIGNLFIEDAHALQEFFDEQNPNLDVKIIFSFTKFGRLYNLSVLHKSVGQWKENIPTSSWELARPYEIPIEKLNDKEFERLCFCIVKSDERFKDVLWLNEEGGSERGRDVLATDQITGERYVFQCKHVKQFSPSAIKKELTKFAKYVEEDPSIKPDVYVLFISTAVTDAIEATGRKLAKDIGMEIKYWPKGDIDWRVSSNPKVKARFAQLLSS